MVREASQTIGAAMMTTGSMKLPGQRRTGQCCDALAPTHRWRERACLLGDYVLVFPLRVQLVHPLGVLVQDQLHGLGI